MTRRLVITADDLGRDERTDATVLALLRERRVSATTAIAVAPGAARAVRRALTLGVTPRLHVALTSERELPPWRALACATELPADPGSLPTLGDGDVLLELAAQLAWLRDLGVAVGGADSHAGTLYGLGGGGWLGPTLHWCAAQRLGFRLPRDVQPYLGGPAPPELAARHRDAVALADELGVALPQTMVTNRRSAVELGSYEALREGLIETLDALPDGTSELFLHPAEGLAGETGAIRAAEARLLRDPVWAEALDAAEIEVVPTWWSTGED